MKLALSLSFVVLITPNLLAQAPTSAVARAEQRLTNLLAPIAKAGDTLFAATLPPRKLPRSLSSPELPLVSSSLLPPAPPKPEGKPVRPRPLPEEAPLSRNFSQPESPQAVSLPTHPLVRLWSGDVSEPLAVPILGTGVSDRASLGDPSLESSVAAAQAKLNPVRTGPVPFQAMNLPDPFEHSRSVRLNTELAELPAPPLSLRPLGR